MSTRLKKEPVSYEELDSDFENDLIDIGDEAVDSMKDVDDVLTDELLEDSEDEKKKKKTAKKQPKKALTKKKAPVKRTTKAPAKKTTQTKLNVTKTTPVETWNKQKVKELSEHYPDNYWKFHADSGHGMLDIINAEHPLESITCNISDQSAISSMSLSEDGTMLATFSSIGSIKIYEAGDDFNLLRKLRDSEETQIDEYYCGAFTPNGLMAVGGKLKDRHRWSEADGDNHILPCDIKIFNLDESKVIARLAGHTEEILTIKAIQFKGENYYISTSQDGSIIKWHVAEDWSTLLDKQKMDDNLTCMAFTVSFLPNTGNKYFLAAVDEHLRLYDFESTKLLQTFSDLYSSYCDCGKFIKWLDEAKYLNKDADSMDIDDEATQDEYAYFITRGAELCDVSDGVSSTPNTCSLHKLVYPTKNGGQFKLELVKKYQNEEYHANSWSVKIASNGRYLLAPTIYGQIFVFNMLTGAVTAIIKEHQDIEIRDVIFHPYRPLLFSCSDDGYVKVYTYKNEAATTTPDQVQQDLDVGMTDA